MKSLYTSSMRTVLKAILTTCVFVGLYPLIRSLPNSQCAFLHFEPVGETAEGTEFCGTDDGAVFLDLKRLRFPILSSLNSSSAPTVGKSTQFYLELKTTQGRPITFEDLAVVHTKRLHLFVIHSSLDDYHHLHPEPDGIPGSYHFEFTPLKQGVYTIFAEMVPLRSASILIAKEEIVVETHNEKMTTASLLDISRDRSTKVINGYHFQLSSVSEKPWTINNENEFHLRVSHTVPNQSITFQRVMGEYAHLAAFDKGNRGFAHLHPLDENPLNEEVEKEAREVTFKFLFNTHLPGIYKIWAQLRIEDKDFFVPFDITISS